MHCQVRTWQGDVVDLPAFLGPFDAVFFNAVFGSVADQKAALTAAALRLKSGGHAVISHPLGRPWLQVGCLPAAGWVESRLWGTAAGGCGIPVRMQSSAAGMF